MPGVPQREAILAITLWRHAAEVGATQVDPRLLANQPPGAGQKKPLQLIAGQGDASSDAPMSSNKCQHALNHCCAACETLPTGCWRVQRMRPVSAAAICSSCAAWRLRALCWSSRSHRH